MRKLLTAWLLLHAIDGQAEQSGWLSDKLKESGMVKPKEESHPFSQIKQCLTATSSQEPGSKIFVFVSFSMPETAWLTLSQEVSEANGTFILRGLPDNSFKELSARLINIKENGLAVPVQISPKLFEEYDIRSVPTFIVLGDKGFDKVAGNISLKHMLELVDQEGGHD